jgi:D-Tyr-tRNAtyr deacylase
VHIEGLVSDLELVNDGPVTIILDEDQRSR